MIDLGRVSMGHTAFIKHTNVQVYRNMAVAHCTVVATTVQSTTAHTLSRSWAKILALNLGRDFS